MTAKKATLRCVICHRDITRCMKIYPYGLEGGPYCYDCAEIDKRQRVKYRAHMRKSAQKGNE